MSTKSKKLNPNSDKDFIYKVDLNEANKFPKFTTGLNLEHFRHISDLNISFNTPISVISGVNRTGKSSILMTLACSHVNFTKRNQNNGVLERQTWSSLVRFTKKDVQTHDWTYHISYKEGNKLDLKKRGQRKANTKKWNGVAKKEGQITKRQVVFIDLDRTLPARFYNNPLFKKLNRSNEITVSTKQENVLNIENYISYILEEQFKLKKLASHQDKDIFTYTDGSNYLYSSYNAATGEEVLMKMIIDIVDADPHSLILIDEIEIGLHPKVQRRLMDVLFNIARNDYKQFIITTHSPTILSSVKPNSRIFIDKNPNGGLQCLQGISINSALSKMDSKSYPLLNIFCEDSLAKKIIKYVIQKMHTNGYHDIHNLITIMDIGKAQDTYDCYLAHKKTYNRKSIRSGYACILDGDMRQIFSQKDDDIFFLLQDKNPELTLVSAFADTQHNLSLNYHLNDTNNHALFSKMVELDLASSTEVAFEKCLNIYTSTPEGVTAINDLISFIQDRISYFSIDL